MRKKSISLALCVVLLAGCMAGCSHKNVERMESADKLVQETTEKKAAFTEKDLDGLVKGIEEHYILEKAKNIDYLHEVEYDKDIVLDVQADSKPVDTSKTGTYTVTYTVTVDTEKMTEYLENKDAKEQKAESKGEQVSKKEVVAEKTDADAGEADTEETVDDEKENAVKKDAEKSDTDAAKDAKEEKKEDSEDTTEIIIDKDMTVVDKEKAEDLAEKGETVWTDKNEVVEPSETKKEEKAENEEKTTKPKEDAKVDTPQKENNSDGGNNKNSGSSNSGNTNSSNNSSNNSKPSGSGGSQSNQTPAHTHNWVEQTIYHEATWRDEEYLIRDEWTETVKEEVYDPWACCNVCGADCTADPGGHAYQHAIAGEGGGHHTEYYKTVTKDVYHDPEYGTRRVDETPAWKETISKCSCGATK